MFKTRPDPVLTIPPSPNLKTLHGPLSSKKDVGYGKIWADERKKLLNIKKEEL